MSSEKVSSQDNSKSVEFVEVEKQQLLELQESTGELMTAAAQISESTDDISGVAEDQADAM